MLGNDNFQVVSHGHLLEHPQREGDLGEWGAGLPGFIATQADLQASPYLADCARLDHAVHQCERAADAEFDAASMARLADTDTARLYLAFMPGTALITSNWPLHLIHQAHALPEGDAREALFAQVRTAIATPQANTMLVARDGWRAVVSAVPAHEVAWTQQLLAGALLDVALTDTGEAFDFSAWLANAVTAGRLQGICPRGD